MDDFDLIGRAGDLFPARAPRGGVVPGGGLVVPERAPPAGGGLDVLLSESVVFNITAHLPQVAFVAEDPDSGEETFENEEEFRRAYDVLGRITIEGALAIAGQRVGEVFERHREELARHYAAAVAASGRRPAAPPVGARAPVRTRMPHSTRGLKGTALWVRPKSDRFA